MRILISNMFRKLFCLILLINITILVISQDWNLIKEKDGIKVYTRKEKGENLKSFRGEAIFNTTFEKISSKLGTKNNFEWWDEDIRDERIIDIVEDEYILYYLMYPLPWPLSSRDLCAKSNIVIDNKNRRKLISAEPIPTAVPKRKGCIRITRFNQYWDVQEINDHQVSVILEGFVDPAGSVPAWIYNMVITETPLKVMKALRKHVE